MNPIDIIDKSWHSILHKIYEEPLKTLNEEILPNVSYQPSKENIFNVFKMKVRDIKVVILGQDPYPRPGDALGYAFAVNEERKMPKSLQVIFKEVQDNYPNQDSIVLLKKWKTLEHWREQGVFLLNTALTVETGKAGSHLKHWRPFTEMVIKYLSYNNPCIWVLWGKKAQEYKAFISNPYYVHNYSKETISKIPHYPDKNYVIEAPHPAAEAYAGGKAGFFGSNCFYYANKILKNKRTNEIIW